MIKEKTFYRAFFALTLSLALQNLLTFGVNLMDTVMLGRYSQEAMSGVSLCNQIQFLLQMLVGGAGEGAVVLGSQYWGKNKLEPIPHIIGVALRFGAVLSALLFGVVLLFPHELLGLLSSDAEVIAQGADYFRIICFSYVIFTVTNIPTVHRRGEDRLRHFLFHAVHQRHAELPFDLRESRLSGAGGPGGGGGHLGLPLRGAADRGLLFKVPGEEAEPDFAEAPLH